MFMNPNAIGSSPAQGNPQQGQSQKLTPEAMNSLRSDPEIAKAVSMVIGKPIDMKMIPDDIMMNIAGMVHKLGVEGAVAEFTKKIPPQVLQQLRGGSGQVGS